MSPALVLQRVGISVAGGEIEGILHLPEGSAAGGVAVVGDLGEGLEAERLVRTCAAIAGSGIGALRLCLREPATLDTALADAASAIRLVRLHPSLTPAAGIVGFGFGGAAAARAAGRDSRVRAAALVEAPAEHEGSRLPLTEITRTRARVLLIGGDAVRFAAVLSQARVTNRALEHVADPESAVADWMKESLPR